MFADIHTHILFKTDDGPKTAEDMYAMVDSMYAQGVRILCATPHFHPEYFGDNREKALKSFGVLKEYCNTKYPDMLVLLGNELFYRHDCVSWLRDGIVNSYAGTRYVLLEFSEADSENHIAEAVDRLLSCGYVPIIAHAERYPKLSIGRMSVLRENGALVQANVQSLFMKFQFKLKSRMKSMLSNQIIDFMATDAHNMTSRPPEIKACYDYLISRYDEDYIEDIFFNNAKELFSQLGAEEVKA